MGDLTVDWFVDNGLLVWFISWVCEPIFLTGWVGVVLLVIVWALFLLLLVRRLFTFFNQAINMLLGI